MKFKKLVQNWYLGLVVEISILVRVFAKVTVILQFSTWDLDEMKIGTQG